MRCYTVDEIATRGIQVTEDGSGPYVEVGEARIPVDASFGQALSAAKKIVLEKINACREEGTYKGEELTSDELFELDYLSAAVSRDPVRALYAEVRGGQIVKDTKREHDALVLVETAPGFGGKIFFLSTSFDEYFDRKSNRIRRKYRQNFPPPGVEVVTHSAIDGSACYLLRMKLGSSFRIERTGRLDGAPRTLIVSWKGPRENRGEPLEVYSPHQPAEPQPLAVSLGQALLG